jgi:hypothetical protein
MPFLHIEAEEFYDANSNPVFATGTIIKVLAGDVNSSNSINNSDVTAVMNYILGSITFSESQRLAADVNCDGSINAHDVQLIQKYIAGTNDTVRG